MICLSYNGMMAQMKNLSKDYDHNVVMWAEKLTDIVQVCTCNL